MIHCNDRDLLLSGRAVEFGRYFCFAKYVDSVVILIHEFILPGDKVAICYALACFSFGKLKTANGEPLSIHNHKLLPQTLTRILALGILNSVSFYLSFTANTICSLDPVNESYSPSASRITHPTGWP